MARESRPKRRVKQTPPAPPRRIPAQLDPLYQVRHKLPLGNPGEALRNSAICKMHLGVPLHQISADMQIPIDHLRLWAKQEHLTKPEVSIEHLTNPNLVIKVNCALTSIDVALKDLEATLQVLDRHKRQLGTARSRLLEAQELMN